VSGEFEKEERGREERSVSTCLSTEEGLEKVSEGSNADGMNRDLF